MVNRCIPSMSLSWDESQRRLAERRRGLADPECKKCNGRGEVSPPQRPAMRRGLGFSRAPLDVSCVCVERAEAREERQARREERVAEKLAESIAEKLAKSLTPNAQAPREVQSVAQQPSAATLLGPDGKPIPTREVQSLAQQLATLHELHQAGALTAAEFARAKSRLIDGFGGQRTP